MRNSISLKFLFAICYYFSDQKRNWRDKMMRFLAHHPYQSARSTRSQLTINAGDTAVLITLIWAEQNVPAYQGQLLFAAQLTDPVIKSLSDGGFLPSSQELGAAHWMWTLHVGNNLPITHTLTSWHTCSSYKITNCKQLLFKIIPLSIKLDYGYNVNSLILNCSIIYTKSPVVKKILFWKSFCDISSH